LDINNTWFYLVLFVFICFYLFLFVFICFFNSMRFLFEIKKEEC